jgi:hypothetical protein
MRASLTPLRGRTTCERFHIENNQKRRKTNAETQSTGIQERRRGRRERVEGRGMDRVNQEL